MDKFLGLKSSKPNKTQEEIPKIENIEIDDKHIPWVEKYRPNSLDDVVHQSAVTDSLKASIRLGKLQHLLFHGPPGTGKTSTILAVN